MEICRTGTNRVVLIFEKIVIKFPRTKNFWRNLWINFMEFIYYLIYHSEFCMPTYFSLFGIITIQKRGKNWGYLDEKGGALDYYSDSLKKYLATKNFSKHERIIINHNSHSNTNLFWDEGKLKYVDYGDAIMFRFIKFCIINKALLV